MLRALPLVVAVLLLLPLLAERVARPVKLLVSRVAISLFGDYVADESPRKRDQQSRLRAAHVRATHRVYAARTLLYSLLLGVSGSILGVYGAAALLWTLRISGDAVRAALPAALGFLADLTHVTDLPLTDLFVLVFVSSATVGTALAFGTYYLRWAILDERASVRASEIEATLPRTIAFVYALSRSGMAFPAILDTLTQNRDVYGEAAVEIGVAVRDMNTFGTDVLTALDRMADRTPSENLEEFGENLASILGSGQSLSNFLKGQYERYQEEAEAQQRQYLDLLSTFAEAYVTVLVAGPLFLITILVVVGLVLQDTLDLLRVVVYLAIPVASLGFIAYIDSSTKTISSTLGDTRSEIPPVQISGITDAETTVALTDGGSAADGWRASRERLELYETFESVLGWLRSPGQTLLRNPGYSFLGTVPIGLWWVAIRAGSLPLAPLAALRTIDSPVVEATLFVTGVFALLYEIDKRRMRSIERVIPDFLDRFASINDAGVSVVQSTERLTRSDLDALSPELQRAWEDVRWGADVRAAFRRMERRIDSPMMTRATVLITNAMTASGEIAPVLEIAADEARASRRLQRERRQEMVTYLLVIYIAFFVFIGIVFALSTSFIPAIEGADLGGASGGGLPSGVSAGVFGGLGTVDTTAYTLLFYHAAVMQATFSGLIAGQLGEGSLADGAKHVVILLTLTVIAFALI
ncbi:MULTISPECIES: type II secretion system F family protein [Halolamina]|uniref:Flagellar protein FlaJ n=1 Tax=Halolamina pelagica TaxID=699431 RepID=A0A1I5NXP8_9EURY|nr:MULTISPECIES: type II secretion system F family protein [Halolamina]NHX36528.1 secretion system protein [Halolamina sp. R1-12]SFP26562.1 flagellar protein FlaJ [Halolamina pelagica]